MVKAKHELNLDVLDEIFDQLRIVRGDSIYLGVDYMRFAAIMGGLRSDALMFSERCIEKILEKIGCLGTLVIPVFNFESIPTGVFDRVYSAGQTGYLGNVLLKKYFINRTAHPFYSFLVFGCLRSRIVSMTNINATGADSPWSEFTKNRFKMVTIGHHYVRSYTISHYLENLVGVDYRYEKNFSVIYRDFEGLETTRNYSFYARKIDRCEFSGITEYCERLFTSKGLVVRADINAVPCYCLDLVGSSRLVLDSLMSGSEKLLGYVRSGDSLIHSNILNGGTLLKLEAS